MKKIVFLLMLTVAAATNSFALNQATCSGTCAKTFNCNNSTSNANPTEFTYPGGAPITGSGSVASSYICDDASSSNNTVASHSNKTYICSYIKYGGTYSDHNVINCYDSGTSAPLNAGLIFLLIAGGGAGFFFLRKQQQKQTSNLAV